MESGARWLPPVTPTPPRPAAPPPPPVASDDSRVPDDPRRPPSRAKRAAGPLAALAALLAKFKAVLLLLPKLKLLTTSGTMLVSVAAYALIWGWEFAVGFVVLLFVHEMGHVIQLRREGIKASAPMFIPFLGAVVAARSLGANALAEARVGLAGPVLGSLGAALCIPLWLLTGNDLFRALAFTGFFLNLFNLLPVVPLDGGRAMAAMAPWMWFAGFVGIVVVAFVFPNPIIVIVGVFAALETWRRWKVRRAGGDAQEAYYRVSSRDRSLVALVYLGLVLALALGMDATHLARTFADA